MDVDLGRLDVEPRIRDLPRSGQAENLLVGLCVEQALCLRRKAAFSPTELPTKIPDEPSTEAGLCDPRHPQQYNKKTETTSR